MIKIKLSPVGMRRAIKYHIVAAEENSKVTGPALDLIGYYLPKEKKLEIDQPKLNSWLTKGAQLTPAVRKLCKIS